MYPHPNPSPAGGRGAKAGEGLKHHHLYAAENRYERPAIGRPMNTPPVAAPGTRTLPSVRPSSLVTLLPLSANSQLSPTCMFAPTSTVSYDGSFWVLARSAKRSPMRE